MPRRWDKRLFKTKLSLVGSRLAVDSSKIRTGGSLTIPLAIASRWRCPPEIFAPNSPVIRTTQPGTILKLELRNPGQVVHLGDAIAQIAPGNAPLVVKAHVTVQDISKVKVCQAEKVSECKQGKVLLRISAYPYPDYGTLWGAVRAITADAITPQIKENTTVAPYYEVTIQPEKLSLEKGGISYPIQPGMEVTADIISRQETVLKFVLRKARLIADL